MKRDSKLPMTDKNPIIGLQCFSNDKIFDLHHKVEIL